MHIHYFQHIPFEGLGVIKDWINRKGHHLTATRWFDGSPDTSGFAGADWLIVVGGTMGVYEQDQYPWMKTEISLIREAISQQKKILAICLGSQLLAHTLGADVYPHTQLEIGWYPIDITFQDRAAPLEKVLPHRLNTFHFHGDTFDVPPGATRFAASAATSNQAFIYGDRVIGLQFHTELTPASLDEMLIPGETAIRSGGPFIQSMEKIHQHLGLIPENNQMLFRLLDYLEAL
ncbi:MAG TPA: gamma-glutamyl-gamma-aminobutyrate hydrolase family protein [Chitinophaga sp.]|uniref:glutamine amidotransferase-related protein n=1 Tax=Chitinophaga sp. TaxID=1869181 RepID=UPI002CDE8D85|nr:gamma-glutamyl-gamma-aminobutyrate hydrolase family protein [Chitinophaga sp.]HVI45687.1 gamma-glutamyl-gamma-aminobutyrate hydrolase family protein [Chitinophaga sp.]